MLYNKNNVRKTNDKKILHKVGKQWKVISVALLMAIGGGAVATHTASAQSNNGVNAATSAEVAALDQKPTMVSAGSATPSSAAKSASASAKPVSNVSYLSGDNGSAASYHAKAENDNYYAQSNGAIVSGYVKSLNAKFGPVTNLLNGRTASASAAAKSDANLSNSYANVAKNSDNKSGVNSLAAKSGLTTGDYASNVAWNVENIYNPAVKSASANASALNLASGLAEKLMGINWSDLSAEANANSAIASANDQVESAKSNAEAYNNASESVSNNDAALNNATVNSIEASGVAAGQALNQSNNNSLINSYASAKSSNATSVSSEVQSYAKANVSHATTTDVKSAGINGYYGYSVTSNHEFAGNSLSDVIGNVASMYAANSVTAKANSVIASAIAAKPSLVANSVSAKSAVAANSVASASAKAASSVAYNVSSAVSYASSAMKSGSANGALYLLNNRGTVKSILASGLSKTNVYEDADVASLASTEGVDLLALKSAKPALDAMAGDFTGITGASALSSKASSVAKSVATDLANATSASASYSNSTDENVTLASYYASSYSVNASSNASLASSYANDTNAFYVANINNPKFTAADNAMRAAQSAEPNDAALANAFGNRVYNYAPKFVTVQKQVALYNVVNGKYNWVVNVPAGVRLTVNGVQIMQNGTVRYQTSYNGKKGTSNSYSSYVQQTYLPTANDVDVTITKPSKVYASVSANGFGKVAAKTLPAGTKLSDVNIVSADNVYGGFTAIETQSGKFVSANIAYAEVNGTDANNNNQANNGSASNNNPVNFWA